MLVKHVESEKRAQQRAKVEQVFVGKDLEALAIHFTRCSGCREWLSKCSCAKVNVVITKCVGVA